MTGISKTFGSIRALHHVDFDMVAGRVHGLVGANGSGKSTLLRVLAGVIQPDAGAIYIDGRKVTSGDPRHMRELGLSFIHQELNLVPKFSAVQNMMLGLAQPTRLGLANLKAERARIEAVAARLHMAFPLDVAVEKLTVAERWLVSIGHALLADARVAAMDEPTASLTMDQCEHLFQIVRELAESGVTILYVSHRLDEIMELSDTVTVLKDGQCVAKWGRGDFSKRDLVRAIAGGDVPEIASPTHAKLGTRRPILEAHNLRRDPRVKDVSFELRAGEVLGLAGLVGSGRTELARLLFGADRPHGGTVLIDGKPYTPRSIPVALSEGVSLVPEDRKSEGLILGKTVTFNVNLPDWFAVCFGRWLPVVNNHAARIRARVATSRVGVVMSSVDVPVRTLSGGNQQKVVMAKWLTTSPRVLVLDEPTRGVDVASRSEIYHIIREQAEAGMGVLVICSELQELEICDRVLVMVEGRIVGELKSPDINEQSILHVIYQSADAEAAAL